MPGRDDDVLNVLNENTQNNNYKEDTPVVNTNDELVILNQNTQDLPSSGVDSKQNKFGLKLNEEETSARESGYLDNSSGVIHTDYDDIAALGGEEELFNEDKLNRSSVVRGVASQGEYRDPEEQRIETSEESKEESSRDLYISILGVTQYSDLRKICGLSDTESFTDYYNRTKYIPKGYEKTARLLMAEEKVKKLYAQYKVGDLGYADFLYRAYGQDILKSQGVDVTSKLYWYNKAKKNDFSNPLDSDTYLSDILAMADQKFQAESWYKTASVDNLKETAISLASGGKITGENLRELFKDQIAIIDEYFESEEEFLKLYKSGYIDLNVFKPFIDVDNDKVYDYYLGTDGKLYAIEGSSGTGKNYCEVDYEDGYDENGYRIIDRVRTSGIFGNGEFGEIMESFSGAFFSVFTGLIDFSAQFVGLVGHWCGNDKAMLNWNSFRNNNLLFGGTNTRDFEGFQADEGDDWGRAVSSAAGTIVGMIASYGIAGAINKAAGTMSTAASNIAKEAGKKSVKAIAANIAAKTMKGAAWAVRTYNGLRGGSVSSVVPELAKHAIANRLVTAAALAIRDGVSTANKLIIQNKILPENQRLSEDKIVGRTMLNIGMNTLISFALRQIGDNGVTSFFKGEKAYLDSVENTIANVGAKATDATLSQTANVIGNKTVSALGATLVGKGINTVGDIVENILTQTNTAFLSNPGELTFEGYMEAMKKLTLNPQFILTNLYIAKQDMGFHLFGRDDSGKRVFRPHTEMDYVKAAIGSIKDIDGFYKEVILKISGKAAEIAETDPERASVIQKGIIDEANRIRQGTTNNESTVESTLKALIFLCNVTVDLPVDSLKLDEKHTQRLSYDERQTGPVKAMMIAEIKNGVAEKLISRSAYALAYYRAAYNQIYKANIDTFKGEFSLYDAYQRGAEIFARDAQPIDEKQEEYVISSKTLTGIDDNNPAYRSHKRIAEAIAKTLPKLSYVVETEWKNPQDIKLTKSEYDAVLKYLNDHADAEAKSEFIKAASLQTENIANPYEPKDTLLHQLNVVLNMAGVNANLDGSVFNNYQYMRETRAEDFKNIESENFKEDFEKTFDIDHIENRENGMFDEKYEKLIANPDVIKYAESQGTDAKTLFASANVISIKGSAVNNLRSEDLNPSMSRCLDVFHKMELIHKIEYNDGGTTKTIYLIPHEGTIFGSLKQTDVIASMLQSVYSLSISQKSDQLESAANIFIDALLQSNVSTITGKDATAYVKEYVNPLDASVDKENNNTVKSSVTSIDFLKDPRYSDGAKKLLATTLAQLALEENKALSRPQILFIFDKLGLDLDMIDTSGPSEDIKLVKDYFDAYNQIEIINDFSRKFANGKIANASQTDLKQFADAKNAILANGKEKVRQWLLDDKIVGKEFYKGIEELNSFIDGQLGEIRENSMFETLVASLKTDSNIRESLGSDEKITKFVQLLYGSTGDELTSEQRQLAQDLIQINKFYTGTQWHDKRNLIIVNLSALETASVHKILRRLESEQMRDPIIDNGKAISSFEKELANSDISTLQFLSELQQNSPSGILTFDINNDTDMKTFSSMMFSLGYDEPTVHGMVTSGISRINGISYTNATSLGLELSLSKKQYDNLIQKSKAIAEDRSNVVDVKSKKPIDIKMSLLDRFGIRLSNEQIENLDYKTIKETFDLEMLDDGSIKLNSLKDVSEAILKIGKSASKLDKRINRIYENGYRDQIGSDELADLSDSLFLVRIIDTVKQYYSNEASGDTEGRLYGFTMSKKDWAGIPKATKALYNNPRTDDNGDGTVKITITEINPKNWNIEYFRKNFLHENAISLQDIFLVPYTDFDKAIIQESEITYGARTINVKNLNTTGANLLEYVRAQIDDRFDDLEVFYKFITEGKLIIGEYKNADEIQNAFVDVVKNSLIKQNESLTNSLAKIGLSTKAIELIYDRSQLERLAEVIQNNMGEYKNLGIDFDGTPIIDKLDYEKISQESGFDIADIKSIVSLIKTFMPNDIDSGDIVLINKSNPWTDVASMIRYNVLQQKAFISVDDIMLLTKEQFEVLKELGLATKELKDKLTLIGKYENGKFKSIIDNNVEYTGQRTTYEIGKETTNILSNGAAFIKNEDTLKLMQGFLDRSQNNAIAKDERTFFNKLSSMKLDHPLNKWLAQKLSLFTTPSTANPGSVFVANVENRLAVGEMLYGIGSLSDVLQDYEFSDGASLKLPADVAMELATKIYFNTTGTDMSASYNRYTLVYKDEQDNWHIENVGENFDDKYYESGSLGYSLRETGLLSGKLKYKEAYIFNTSKNVMSANAASFGENIKVMNLNDDKLNTLRSIIIMNVIQELHESGKINLNDINDEALAEVVNQRLGSYISKIEVRKQYTRSSTQEILNNVFERIGWDDAEKQIALNILSNYVDRLVNSTLETPESLNSASERLKISEQANLELDKIKGTISDDDHQRLKTKINTMLENIYDGFTFMINKDALPEDVKAQIITMRDDAKRELFNLTNNEKFAEIILSLKEDDSEIKYTELRQLLREIPMKEQADVLAAMLKFKFLNEDKGKYLQYALLGSDKYFEEIKNTAEQQPTGWLKEKVSIYDDINEFLTKLQMSEYVLDNDEILSRMSKIGSNTFESYWSGSLKDFKESYDQLQSVTTDKLVNDLVKLRSAVFVSDEAGFLRKTMWQDYNNYSGFESTRDMIDWLSSVDAEGHSNIDKFRTNLSLFVIKDPNGISQSQWEDGQEKLNKLFLCVRNQYHKGDKTFTMEEFLKLPSEEIQKYAIRFRSEIKNLPLNHADADDVAVYCNKFVSEENRENFLKAKYARNEGADRREINKVYNAVIKQAGLDYLDDDVKKMIIDQSASLLCGKFSDSFKQNSRDFKINVDGPSFKKGIRMNYLEDKIDKIMESLQVSRKWSMVSGLNAGDEVILSDGTKSTMQSTDIGLSKEYFESLVGGTVDAYREMVGAEPDEDLYIELYRNPGIGNNVINTYKIKFISGKNHNDVMLTPDIFAAYHGGDFDSDKILILKPTKTTQLNGKQNLEVTEKVWSAADKILNVIKGTAVKNSAEIIKDFEDKYNVTILQLLKEIREDNVPFEHKQIIDEAIEDGYITKVDPSKYKTLKSEEKNKPIVFSEYVLDKDLEGNQILRRLSLDTKFAIDEILRVKDSSTGYATKRFKPMLEGLQKKIEDASEFFTYNQFNLSKASKTKLATYMSTEESKTQIADLTIKSITESFGKDIADDISEFLKLSLVPVTEEKSGDINSTSIIKAFRLAEFLYRDSEPFKESFNKTIQNRIDNIQDDELKEMVSNLYEYAQLLKADIPLDSITIRTITKNKGFESIEQAIKSLSHNDLLNVQYDLIKRLEPQFEQGRYVGRGNDTTIPTALINKIRAQELNLTDESSVEYIDGIDSKNYLTASFLVATGQKGLIKDVSPDTFKFIDTRFSLHRIEPHEVNFFNLSDEDIKNFKLAFSDEKHSKLSIGNKLTINHNEEIAWIKLRNGEILGSDDVFDGEGKLKINPEDIRFVNVSIAHGAKGNKFAMANSGQGKGTIATVITSDHYDLDSDIKIFQDFFEENEKLFSILKERINKKDYIIDLANKSIDETDKAIETIKPKYEELSKFYDEFRKLKQEYIDAKLSFDEKQKAKGDQTWDKLADSYELADEKERARIRKLHSNIKSKYIKKLDNLETKISNLSEDISNLLDSSHAENIKQLYADKWDKIKDLMFVIKEKRKAREDYNLFFKEKLNSIHDKERLLLSERMFNYGLSSEDIDSYDIPSMSLEEVRRLNNEFKSISGVMASNLMDFKKQGFTSDDYEFTYYDKFMNQIDDPEEAAFTKITSRWFFPEGNSFWNKDVQSKPLDAISFANDRTNPDSIIRFQGAYYSKKKMSDGTYAYVYDSKRANEISRVIQKKDMPWASPSNGLRIYNVFLAKLLYEHCSALQKEMSDINPLIKTLLDGNLTTSSTGRKIIFKIQEKMSDDEIRNLYTSKDPYAKLILSFMYKFMPALSETDAKELDSSKGLLTKNKGKEIARNKTPLYYYTKAQGPILSGQRHLSGGEKDANGYPFKDVSESYYPLYLFIREISRLENGNKTDWLFSNSKMGNLTLRKILNYANGDSGVQVDGFKPHMMQDTVADVRKTSALEGNSDTKAGDAPAAAKTITPEQRVISQYAGIEDTLDSLLKANNGNGIFDENIYKDYIEGRYSSKLLNQIPEANKDGYIQQHSFDNAVYGADFKNKTGKAAAISQQSDEVIREISPRYLTIDPQYGITYSSHPDSFEGTVENFYDTAFSLLPRQKEIYDSLFPKTNLLSVNYLSEKDESLLKLEQIVKDANEKILGSNERITGDIQHVNVLDDDDLNYLRGNNVNGKTSSDYEDQEYDKIISSIKSSKDIAVFKTDRLMSSNIKHAGMDRAVIAYNANVKGYSKILLGKEFIIFNRLMNSSKEYRDGYNRYTKLKNLMSSYSYCNEKVNSEKISEQSKEYYNNVIAEIFKELEITSPEQLNLVEQRISFYSGLYTEADKLIDTVCERVYAAEKAYCNETGQTCPSRERFFLPIKHVTSLDDKETNKHNSSLLFAGTAKFTVNPFSIRKETTGLNPAGEYKEFDVMANIVSAATEVGHLQALLTYRDEAKANGAMSNALSFDKTCEIIGSKLNPEEMNQYGSSDPNGSEIKGFGFFVSQAMDMLDIAINASGSQTSCAKYADAYNQIYNKVILPLKESYVDISFGHLLTVAMNNPQDLIVDNALKAYSIMMDAIGKITTIQIQSGAKVTLTDEIYNGITKYAEDNGYVIVDQFGREYNKDLSQFKALSPFATDDYIFRLTHGDLATEGTYEQNVALDALRGDLYFMDPTVAKHTQGMFYTREPSEIKKVTNVVKNLAVRLIMNNPIKFVSRMFNFSMFDLNSSLMTGNFGMITKVPQMAREISGYLQSNGEYCPDSLREFMNVTGVDPLKEQTFYGESSKTSKDPYSNFIGKQFTAQHLANRYALWLDIKETLDNNGCNVESIIPRLGNSYYLKDQIREMADNMKTEIAGIGEQSASSRIAAFIVSNAYGTYNDMPGLAKSMSNHGFIFTTFPMALVRFARNEVLSGATVVKEIFTGTADTNTLKYMGRQVGSLASLALIQFLFQVLPALLSGDDDEDKKELVEAAIKDDASLDLFQSVLLDDAVYNTSTVWNPFYGAKNIFIKPAADAIKNGKANDETALQIVGDTFANYFRDNVWNRLNPIYTTIPNAIIPTNKWTNPYGNQGTNFFDNLARRSLSYSMGTSGANAFINSIQSSKYDDDRNFIEKLGYCFNNAIQEEAGNSKSFKSDWKNYNSALSIIYQYAKESDKTTYDPTSSSFDKNYKTGLKARLKNAMHVKSSPSVIYKIIKEALDSHASKEEVREAIRSVSVRVQISKLVNQNEFFDSLSQKDYNTVKSALAYEDSIFPNLDDLYDESQREIISRETSNKKASFKYVGSIKSYGYNYPTYTSSTYKQSRKNYRYNNLNNWNTNTYNKNKYRQQMLNPTDTYNQMRQNQAYGTSKDVWGNETRHYTDGTTYQVRQQGMPFPGGNE